MPPDDRERVCREKIVDQQSHLKEGNKSTVNFKEQSIRTINSKSLKLPTQAKSKQKTINPWKVMLFFIIICKCRQRQRMRNQIYGSNSIFRNLLDYNFSVFKGNFNVVNEVLNGLVLLYL